MRRAAAERSIERDAQPNFCALGWGVLLVPQGCVRCGCATQAVALWLPPGHEVLLVDEDGGECWQTSPDCRLLHRVVWIDPAARRSLSGLVPGFRRDAAPGAEPCWVGHCEHCGVAVDGLDCEPVEFVRWWCGGDSGGELQVVPVVGPLAAEARACSVGDLADAPLQALVLAAEAVDTRDDPG